MRIELIITQMKQLELDAMVVSYGNNVLFLSGFKGTAGTLFVTDEQVYLLTDFRYIAQAKAQTEKIEIVDVAEGERTIYERLVKKHNIKKVGFESKYVTYSRFLTMKKMFEGTELVPVENMVENLRMVKTPEEIKLLGRACEIADVAFESVCPAIKEGMSELEIAAMLEFEMKRRGATGASFETIVASGARSAMPHGTASTKVLEKGEFVVMDFGCVYGGYCSDITRTVAIGDISDKQRDIYNKVLTVQEECLKLIKPGAESKSVDTTSRAMFKTWGIDKFFGHSLGHGVGLDIHELPNLSPKSEYVLESGMVVTNEPGIYLDGEFGVRIEDTVLVTEKGCERLTKSSKELRICRG